MKLGSQVIRMTLILVLAYLTFRHWRGATAVLRAGGRAYADSVTALKRTV